MSGLLLDMAELCCTVTVSETTDTEGGKTRTLTDGTEFYAAIAANNNPEVTIGGQRVLLPAYNVIVDGFVSLAYGDMFKRKSDGALFRVTSDVKASPGLSMLELKNITAERVEEF